MTRGLLPTVLFLASATANAQLSRNDTCEVASAVTMSARAGGKGRKTKIKKGAELTVVRPGPKWTRVKYGRKTGFVRSKSLKANCSASAPEPPAPVEEITATPQPDLTPPPAGSSSQSFGKTYKMKIAVMDLQAIGEISPDLMTSLTGVVPETLDSLGLFKAMSMQEVKQMLEYESVKQYLGCDDMSCLAELGGALGADFMVSGNITLTDGDYVIQLQLANIAESRIESRTSREYDGDSQGLFQQLRGATRVLVRDLLGQQSGTLMVRSNEEGASIEVDGTIVGVTPLDAPISLAGGAHALVVKKDLFVVSRQDMMITPNELLELEVHLVPSADFVAAYREDAEFTRTMAWLSVSIGAAALAGATTLYVVGLDKAEYLRTQSKAYNTSAREHDRYQRLNGLEEELAIMDVAAVSAAATALVAAGIGITLFIMGDDPDRYEAVESLRIEEKKQPGIVLPRVGLVISANGLVLAGEF